MDYIFDEAQSMTLDDVRVVIGFDLSRDEDADHVVFGVYGGVRGPSIDQPVEPLLVASRIHAGRRRDIGGDLVQVITLLPT